MTTETPALVLATINLTAADRHIRRPSAPARNMIRLNERPVPQGAMPNAYRPSSPDRISSWEFEMTTPNTGYWRGGRRR